MRPEATPNQAGVAEVKVKSLSEQIEETEAFLRQMFDQLCIQCGVFNR